MLTQTSAECVALDGRLDIVHYKRHTPQIQNRPQDIISLNKTIRPTKDSSDSEIDYYFAIAGEICKTAKLNIIESNILDEKYILRIAPVDGCYSGRPPAPRVTISEVIAVILSNDFFYDNQNRSQRIRIMRTIAKEIQRESRVVRMNRLFKTYVLFYRDLEQGTDEAEARNDLVGLDLDADSASFDAAREAAEQEALLNSVGAIYTPKIVSHAVGYHRGSLEWPFMIGRSCVSSELVADVLRDQVKGLLVVIIGFSSAAVLFGAILSLLTLNISNDAQMLISTIGLAGGILLWYSGELAKVLLRKELR